MTLDEAAKFYHWSAAHDYERATIQDGKIVAIEGLGIWEEDLLQLTEEVPDLVTSTRRRVDNGMGYWLRVDLREPKS